MKPSSAASLALCVCLTLVHGPASLTLIFPDIQGPGTPGFGVISDPTIQAYSSPGVPAPLGLVLTIDLLGNGRPDVLACYGAFPPSTITKVPCRILRPQADGSVADITRQLLGSGALPLVTHPREFVFGDFNHDGRPDIFVADTGYDAPPYPRAINVLLISNTNGTYTDRSSTLPQTPDFSHSATAGDINGDGNLDIFVGNLGWTFPPYFLIGRGDGTFDQATNLIPADVEAENGNSYFSSQLVDLDQDGAPDLVLGSAGNGDTRNIVLFNDGTGSFTQRPRYLLPAAVQHYVVDIEPIDINRDGRMDLILVTQATNAALGGFGLQVLINQSNGTFVDETAARLPASTARATGHFAAFIRFVDFNGDGWEDFYADSNSWPDAAPRVWLNSGSGSWTPVDPSSIPARSQEAIIHAVDFDADGRPDILRLGWGGTGVNIGYKSFLNRTTRTVPSEPIIGTAIARNARASIAFTAPLSGDASSYTATCNPGQVSKTGALSPITVTGLTNGRHYSCIVTAANPSGSSMSSGAVTVTPFVLPFIDNSLAAGATGVKAAHVTELRTRINGVRAAAGLEAFSWTDGTLTATSSVVKAVHIAELRTALTQAYTAAGLTLPTFTDTTLTGVVVKALHITEIRAAIVLIE